MPCCMPVWISNLKWIIILSLKSCTLTSRLPSVCYAVCLSEFKTRIELLSYSSSDVWGFIMRFILPLYIFCLVVKLNWRNILAIIWVLTYLLPLLAILNACADFKLELNYDLTTEMAYSDFLTTLVCHAVCLSEF